MDAHGGGDVDGLAFRLRRAVEGEVRFDPGSRHLYSTDASNFRQVPVGVVVPRTVDDVVATVATCREFEVPITSRGGGTSLAGQCCNVAVVVDFSKYLHGVEAIDPVGRTARVMPGTVLDVLRAEAHDHGLTWGPSPSTHDRCTVGGMIGNNACGMHAFAYGRTDQNVVDLDVLLYDGTRFTARRVDADELDRLAGGGGRPAEIHRRLRDLRDTHANRIRETFPDIPRRVSGYNLDALLPENGFDLPAALVGTEGTCATVLGATIRLNPFPSSAVLLVLGFAEVGAAARAVSTVRHASGLFALEGFDRRLIDDIREKGHHNVALEHLPDAGAWLVCEFRAEDQGDAVTAARGLQRDAEGLDGNCGARLYTDPDDQARVWRAREAALAATSRFRGKPHFGGWEDSAVHPDRLAPYLEELLGLFRSNGFDPAIYGHFGDGCVHCRLDFDLRSTEGVARYRQVVEEAAELVVRHGGSLSGEHGDGQQRGELLERMYGPALVAAMQEFKHIWDPDGMMNPGKVVEARPLDEDLRVGPDHQPWEPAETVFAYPDDGGSWNRAQERCVGVGRCRRDDGRGSMCPSYFVTREEMHSTRGRARLLFEMMRPETELDGWDDTHVHEALSLCLSCKACANDCPVNVDMATYKAEFNHHHYQGRRRPRVHYALGMIDVWSRIAQRMPGLANLTLRAPVLSRIVKQVAGVAPQRPAPRYAAETFREWFAQRETAGRRGDRPGVVLLADTFTEHFAPSVGRAAVAILEGAGHHVELNPGPFCCGRPLYDHGMLERARAYLERLVEVFAPLVADGAHIVGLEPSCVAVFRDELRQMFPDDPDARAVADATSLLSEFLVSDPDFVFPVLERRALVHGHCHHKAVLGFDHDARALDAMGLDWEELDASCCGLAGSFGFEAGDKFEVSVAAGERKLLPRIRAADPGDLIIADGFSCRTQIEHLQGLNGGPGRRALHLAEVILLAQRTGPSGSSSSGFVEDELLPDPPAGVTRKDLAMVGGLAGALVLGAIVRRARN